MSVQNEIKKLCSKITGLSVRIRDNSDFWTISNKDSHLPIGFGHFKKELEAVFQVISLDGGSFNIKK